MALASGCSSCAICMAGKAHLNKSIQTRGVIYWHAIILSLHSAAKTVFVHCNPCIDWRLQPCRHVACMPLASHPPVKGARNLMGGHVGCQLKQSVLEQPGEAPPL